MPDIARRLEAFEASEGVARTGTSARRGGDDIQADRLSNFAWFHMEFLCQVPEYARFVARLTRWLHGGECAS